ncbi:AAA domain-containing protein [Bacillus cihuensis]|uniref:AAA domain-containing protein n=1 Tax=Bacillus cihuensis TaxID=1208599 RepID=UPI0004127534|nr:AAA domain-containing protein [Bacillus cihuensis]
MNSTVSYIKEWQSALDNEIRHLKKYGSTKYHVLNGHLIDQVDGFTYYFETVGSLRIPVGSIVRLEWGGIKQDGFVLSSEGKSIILLFEKTLGDLISEAYLYHDPWELLEQLIERLDEMKKSKKKRLRVKRLMDPSMESRHPIAQDHSSVKELFLRSNFNPITYVWGPPGTGKTYTLARTAANHYFKGKKLLVLSHSNQAVDVLMAEISAFTKKKQRFKEGDILRYGSHTGESLANHLDIISSQLLEKFEPDLVEDKQKLTEEKRLLKQDLSGSFSKRDTDRLIELEKKLGRIIEKFHRKEMELVKQAKIVGSTLAKAASDSTIFEKEYDVIIVDEASMAYVPQVAFAASLGKNIIVCGDFKQLPPIASARDESVNKWLKEDIFHRSEVANVVNEGKLHPHLFLLKEQRRMHPDISAFTNKFIYHSLVGDHKSVLMSREEITGRRPFPNRALMLLETSGTGEHCITERSSKSRINLWQLFISFQLLHEAYSSGSRSIGYVTPYRAQSCLMDLLLQDIYKKELELADIIAATVHRFQGSERDVMIFDTVDSYPETRPGMLLTGKNSERLINVAITRTKGKFIQVSDADYIRKKVYLGKTLRKLVDHQASYGYTVRPKDIGKWIQNQHPKLQWMHARKLDVLSKDIKKARHSILLSIPDTGIVTEEWINMLNSKEQHVKITLISTRPVPGLAVVEQIETSVAFPFIIIDKQYFWLGVPLEAASRLLPPYVAARLDSVAVVEHFLTQLPGIE